MTLQQFYTALLTADLARAETWYAKLLGRGPDFRPLDTLVQWELLPDSGLQVASTDEIAGPDTLSLVVADVGAERVRLAEEGPSLGENRQGTYSTLAQISDPTAIASFSSRRLRRAIRAPDESGDT